MDVKCKVQFDSSTPAVQKGNSLQFHLALLPFTIMFLVTGSRSRVSPRLFLLQLSHEKPANKRQNATLLQHPINSYIVILIVRLLIKLYKITIIQSFIEFKYNFIIQEDFYRCLLSSAIVAALAGWTETQTNNLNH